MPQKQWRLDPVTTLVNALIAVWMLWFGITVLSIAGRPRSFFGPERVFPLHTWGWIFIAGGVWGLVRLLLLHWPRGAIVTMIPVQLILLTWMVGWYTGPLSTAQPAYSFVALVAVGLPFLRPLVERYFDVVPRGE